MPKCLLGSAKVIFAVLKLMGGILRASSTHGLAQHSPQLSEQQVDKVTQCCKLPCTVTKHLQRHVRVCCVTGFQDKITQTLTKEQLLFIT